MKTYLLGVLKRVVDGDQGPPVGVEQGRCVVATTLAAALAKAIGVDFENARLSTGRSA